MSGVNPNDLDRAASLAGLQCTTLVALSGLDADKLIQIANHLSLMQRFASDQVREIIVDYIPPVTEQAFYFDAERTAAQPVIVRPAKITYRLEDHDFGGSTYVAVTAEGHVIGGPFRFTSYEDLGHTTLGGKR